MFECQATLTHTHHGHGFAFFLLALFAGCFLGISLATVGFALLGFTCLTLGFLGIGLAAVGFTLLGFEGLLLFLSLLGLLALQLCLNRLVDGLRLFAGGNAGLFVGWVGDDGNVIQGCDALDVTNPYFLAVDGLVGALV